MQDIRKAIHPHTVDIWETSSTTVSVPYFIFRHFLPCCIFVKYPCFCKVSLNCRLSLNVEPSFTLYAGFKMAWACCRRVISNTISRMRHFPHSLIHRCRPYASLVQSNRSQILPFIPTVGDPEFADVLDVGRQECRYRDETVSGSASGGRCWKRSVVAVTHPLGQQDGSLSAPRGGSEGQGSWVRLPVVCMAGCLGSERGL